MAEKPPDNFPSSPTLSGADCFPENMSAPGAGIFDSPAHLAIINQDWISRLLGVFDGLMYTEAWEPGDAEHAYNELLQLQAMLMSPANYLIPSGTFQQTTNLTGASIGNTLDGLITVPAGKRYRMTYLSVMSIGGTNSLLALRVNHAGKENYLDRKVNPPEGVPVVWNGDLWLYAGDIVRYQYNFAATGGNLWVSASGLVYDEV